MEGADAVAEGRSLLIRKVAAQRQIGEQDAAARAHDAKGFAEDLCPVRGIEQRFLAPPEIIQMISAAQIVIVGDGEGNLCREAGVGGAACCKAKLIFRDIGRTDRSAID